MLGVRRQRYPRPHVLFHSPDIRPSIPFRLAATPATVSTNPCEKIKQSKIYRSSTPAVLVSRSNTASVAACNKINRGAAYNLRLHSCLCNVAAILTSTASSASNPRLSPSKPCGVQCARAISVAMEQTDLRGAWHTAAKEVAYKYLDLRKESWKDYTIHDKGVVHKELLAQFSCDPPQGQ